jgi:L-2-hydroxyglutarate oxidase
MADVIRGAGGEIVFGTPVERIAETADAVEVEAKGKIWRAKQLIVCGGLQADRLARMAGMKVDYRVIPFRGEYFVLPPRLNGVVRHLIYPIPDPALPFLGIHLTRMIDGSVTVGPNAVLGFAREGYGRFALDLGDTLSAVSYPGFWRTLFRHRKSAVTELRNSLWKAGYLRECQKYCPELTLADLLPYRPGIRAQAVAPDGTLIHDFLFRETARMLHVCNAPSPAATSALPIGTLIADKCLAALS